MAKQNNKQNIVYSILSDVCGGKKKIVQFFVLFSYFTVERRCVNTQSRIGENCISQHYYSKEELRLREKNNDDKTNT